MGSQGSLGSVATDDNTRKFMRVYVNLKPVVDLIEYIKV